MEDTYLERAEVRIERIFDASPPEVFDAWVNPGTMSRWMWASLGKNVWAENDLRVGGAFRVYTRFEGGRHQGPGWSGMCGIYVEIRPPEKLTFTLHWDGDVGYNQGDRLVLDEVVTVTLDRSGDQTRMEFVQLGIPDEGGSADTHRAGLQESFDMLDEVLAGSSASP